MPQILSALPEVYQCVHNKMKTKFVSYSIKALGPDLMSALGSQTTGNLSCTCWQAAITVLSPLQAQSITGLWPGSNYIAS